MKKILVLLLLSLLMAACGSDSDGDDAGTTPDASVLIEAAAAQLDAVESFQLLLELSGAPAPLDSSAINMDFDIILTRAEGVFVAPESLGGTVTVQLDDTATDVSMIAVANEQFLNHPLITFGRWQEMTFSEGFNPASFVTGDVTIANALRTMQNAEYIGIEDIDGIEMHHIRGDVPAENVSAVTVGLIGTEEGMIPTDIYIRTRDERLEQLILTEPPLAGAEEGTVWTIGLYDYNGDYTVERPDVAE